MSLINEKRHYVIQTAFEELGMRDVSEIHPEMFKRTCQSVGISTSEFGRLSTYQPVQELLQSLAARLKQNFDDDFILGMLLGLELPAEDNISSVFWSSAFDRDAEELLRNSKFFKLHMALEVEHIRLTVSNFIRFCISEDQKRHFQEGFLVGIEFWSDFWRELGRLAMSLDLVGQGA
jgi:Iron-containing redox enzyme